MHNCRYPVSPGSSGKAYLSLRQPSVALSAANGARRRNAAPQPLCVQDLSEHQQTMLPVASIPLILLDLPKRDAPLTQPVSASTCPEASTSFVPHSSSLSLPSLFLFYLHCSLLHQIRSFCPCLSMVAPSACSSLVPESLCDSA